MQRVCSAADAQRNFTQILTAAAAAGDETVIRRGDEPVAVVMGYAEYRDLMELRRYFQDRESRFSVYDEIRAKNADAGPEQVAEDVGAAVRAVRGAGGTG